MHRSRFDLQYYVPRAGDQVFAPPFTLDKEDALAFVLKANKDKLNALLDRELNQPWERAFAHRGLRHRYEAAGDWVILVLSDVKELYPAVFEKLRSTKDDPKKRKEELDALKEKFGSQSKAWIEAMSEVTARQRELIVMLPLNDLGPDPESGEVVPRSSRLWYMPIVLNDLPPAVAAGRELFGYPKLLARFSFKDAKNKEKPLLEPPEENSDELRDAPWDTVTVDTYAPAPVKGDDGSVSYRLDLVNVLTITRDRDAPTPSDRTDKRIVEEVERLLDEPVEFLFLRQFRDPEFEGFASYQAAVTGSVTVPPGSKTQWLKRLPAAKQFRFHFPKLAEQYPAIVDALGVLPDKNTSDVTPSGGFWVKDQKLLVTRGSIEWDKS